MAQLPKIPREYHDELALRSGRGETLGEIQSWLATQDVRVSRQAINTRLTLIRAQRADATHVAVAAKLQTTAIGDIDRLGEIQSELREMALTLATAIDEALQHETESGKPKPNFHAAAALASAWRAVKAEEAARIDQRFKLLGLQEKVKLREVPKLSDEELTSQAVIALQVLQKRTAAA